VEGGEDIEPAALAAGLERPTSGCVTLFGEDLGKLDEDGRARLRRGRVSLLDDGGSAVTEREREILTLLSRKPGQTVPREEFAAHEDISNERTVDVQINRLRRKIESDPANPLHLQTVRGIGYRLIAT
jgi:two-component system phosphate regulon response regulator OmpR